MKKDKRIFFMAMVILSGAIIMTNCGGGNGGDDGGDDTPTVPNAPAIQRIDASDRELTVQWGPVRDANTYNLYWNTTGGVTTTDTSVTGLLTSFYVHSGLCLFNTYSYMVIAVNSLGESAQSNEMRSLGAATITAELQKKLASDADDSDNFGFSVSSSGDNVVVGAPFESGAGGYRGAAYIYERNYGGQNNWGEVKKLTASDTQDSDVFGMSVAISGDYVVVGAYYEDTGGADSGAAYIFNRNTGGLDNWGEVKKLMASDADTLDYFGRSCDISGDYVVVGAHYEDAAGTDRGAAYIYERNYGGSDNWGEVKKLMASDAQDSDLFGNSVAISGDYVVVGAQYEDGAFGGNNRGAAYIFNRNTGGPDNWGEVTKLTASDAENGDNYSYSVYISGDYVVAGANGEDGPLGGNNRGAAYIYGRNYGGQDNWGEMAKLTASDAQDLDSFGIAVAISGDYIVVGAVTEDGGIGGNNRGAVYIFGRNTGGQDNWGEVVKLTASDAEDDDWFGNAVSISDDYVVVGADLEDDIGSNRGAIYIF
jgi:hypothetical protein